MDKCFIILVIMLGVQRSYIVSEPVCSKYDYEEKMLEKVIRGEIKMERMMGDIDNVKSELTKMNMDIDAKIESLSTMINDVKEQVTSLSQDLEQRKIETDVKVLTTTTPTVITPNSVVAFSAKKIANVSLGFGNTIIFSDVDYNEGGGYDSVNGIFTAPKSAWYLFLVSICQASYSEDATYSILKDDNKILTLTVRVTFTKHRFAYGLNCHSQSVITKVTSGQELKLQCESSICDLYQDHNPVNMFSGFLLIEV